MKPILTAAHAIILGTAALGVTLLIAPSLLAFFVRTHAGRTPK